MFCYHLNVTFQLTVLFLNQVLHTYLKPELYTVHEKFILKNMQTKCLPYDGTEHPGQEVESCLQFLDKLK